MLLVGCSRLTKNMQEKPSSSLGRNQTLLPLGFFLVSFPVLQPCYAKPVNAIVVLVSVYWFLLECSCVILGHMATNMVEMIAVLKKDQEESMTESQEEGVAEKVDSHEERVRARKVKKMRKKVSDPHRKRACVDCTKRCVRVHGRASSSEKVRLVATLPSFFKIMMGYFSENMDIPPPFAKTILDLTGSNIYLEDAFGLRWRVQVCLHDGFLSFGHGWKNFVLDHAVSVGEFLVFRQTARSVFTVQIFATSACERLYLCERNKRQSRKRKPREKTSSPANQAVNVSKNNGVERSKKKRRTYHLQNDLGTSDCDMSVHVCIDPETPKAASELKCSETSGQAPGNRAAESPEVDEVSTRDQDKAHDVLYGETEAGDDCTICKEKETECDATVGEHPIYDATGSNTLESMVAIEAPSNTKDMIVDENTETENCGASEFPTNAELRTTLVTMDLNEEITDDIFLSADIYEFESDFCNPEAFSVELNMEGLTTNGQTSGLSCSGNCDSSIGVGHYFRMREASSCLENKEITDVPRTSTDAGSDPVHDIDINALPSNELSAFREDSSPDIGAEVPSGECAIETCKNNKDNLLFPPEGNQVEPKGFVPEDSSAKQDNLQMQDGPGQIAGEIMSSSRKPREIPKLRQNPMRSGNNCEGLKSGNLKANNRKFSVTVPPPDQTWLELPCRLPVLPRTKKQGRKILVLKDPCTRRWPVLYQCTPNFNGFITGWVDISRENNLREGDACEFELCSNSELSFQVRMLDTQ